MNRIIPKNGIEGCIRAVCYVFVSIQIKEQHMEDRFRLLVDTKLGERKLDRLSDFLILHNKVKNVQMADSWRIGRNLDISVVLEGKNIDKDNPTVRVESEVGSVHLVDLLPFGFSVPIGFWISSAGV
jgi:hypothetical protein